MTTAPSLDELRDIHLPPPPYLTTLVPEGWEAALVVAALALVAAACWGLRRFMRRRCLRRALRELAGLAAEHRRDGDATRLAAGLSRLLRRYAVDRFPQAEVACLTGSDWLRFLDAHGGQGAFVDGAGAALAWRPYRAAGEVDAAALIAVVRCWLQANPT